jgi:hypothetical protein
MSASTGTIQRPLAYGSILGAIALGVATLFAVGALAWGAVSLTATKGAPAAAPAPATLDRGSRFEAQQLGPMPYSPAQVQGRPQVQAAPATPFVGDSLVSGPDATTSHATHPRHAAAR